MFTKATKSKSKLRMAIFGPAGCGKTYTSLTLATSMGKTAVIDTERGSASKYADLFNFDVVELVDFAPQRYIEAIHAAESAGYEVLVIDSLSHAWNAQGGVLDMVDRAAARSQSNNSFTAWRNVTPIHNSLVDAILNTPIHVIATMRSKTEYVLEINDKGKQIPRKVGLAPIQRDGMEYEFDVCGEMDWENNLVIGKTRCSALAGAVIEKPGKALANTLVSWLSDGSEPQHWALNGGGHRITRIMQELRLSWDEIKGAIEPGNALTKMSDTTLLEWQFEARLHEIAQGRQ